MVYRVRVSVFGKVIIQDHKIQSLTKVSIERSRILVKKKVILKNEITILAILILAKKVIYTQGELFETRGYFENEIRSDVVYLPSSFLKTLL